LRDGRPVWLKFVAVLQFQRKQTFVRLTVAEFSVRKDEVDSRADWRRGGWGAPLALTLAVFRFVAVAA
jgi:hypothetical protein